jgi:hypothetical protein
MAFVTWLVSKKILLATFASLLETTASISPKPAPEIHKLKSKIIVEFFLSLWSRI